MLSSCMPPSLAKCLLNKNVRMNPFITTCTATNTHNKMTLRCMSDTSGASSSPPRPNMHFAKPQPVRLEFLQKSPLKSADLEDIDISLGYHRQAITASDKVAYGMVKFLRVFADLFFQKRYIHRSIVLETVAAVPGMVAGMIRHMRSLRKIVNRPICSHTFRYIYVRVYARAYVNPHRSIWCMNA